MKLKPYDEAHKIEDARADFEAATKIDQFRVGHEAFYFPTFLSQTYIPFRDMTNVRATNKSLQMKSCCGGGGCVPMPVVAMEVGGETKTFQFTKLEKAKEAARLINE